MQVNKQVREGDGNKNSKRSATWLTSLANDVKWWLFSLLFLVSVVKSKIESNQGYKHHSASTTPPLIHTSIHIRPCIDISCSLHTFYRPPTWPFGNGLIQLTATLIAMAMTPMIQKTDA